MFGKSFSPFRLPRFFLALGLSVGPLVLPLRAADRDTSFVEGLRDRGLHNLALEYLEQSKSSSLVSAEFKQRIPYEQGVTELELARRLPSPDARTNALESARRQFEAFAEVQKGNPLATEALLQLAGVFAERAKQNIARIKLETGAVHKHPDVAGIRRDLEEAQKLYTSADRELSAQLDKLKGLDPDSQPKEAQNRLELRVRQAQARVLNARLGYDLAQLYAEDDKKFKQLNEQAADKLGEHFETYVRAPQTSLIGFYAHLYEGQCYQALKNWKAAQGCYADLIDQPAKTPLLRKLISLAHSYQAECFNAQEKFDDTLVRTAQWIESSASAELKQPEWLAVQYQVAQAASEKAAPLPANDRDKRRLTTQARDLFRQVAEQPGEHQRLARAALAKLGATAGERAQEPKTFAEAYAAGKEAIQSANAAQLATGVAEENNPEALSELKLQAKNGMVDAQVYFQLALRLVDGETQLEQLNEIRYLLSWLHFQKQEYLQAALLGEFVATRYEADPMSETSARVALASWEQLAATRDPQAGAFAGDHLVKLAKLVTSRWPDSDTAESAFSMMLTQALRSNQISDARKLLEQIDEKRRPMYELRLANALWERQLTAPAETPALREQKRAEAATLLRESFEKLRSADEVTPTQATGALYLAQSYLDEAKYNDAIKLLEDKKVGPLNLLDTSNLVASKPAYAVEAYKAALRGYVSVSPPQNDNALKTLTNLERAVKKLEGGNQDELLTRIYVSLGRQLQVQIESLTAAGRQAEAQALSGAFSTFLDKLHERAGGLDWPVRQWISQTYFALAEGMGEKPANSKEQQKYYERAEQGLGQLLASADEAPSPTALLHCRIQHAQSLRRLGKFEAAIEAFTAILREREMMLDVQAAAASTYEEWGIAGEAVRLESAIFGGRQVRDTGDNRIWGWVKLAQVAAQAARSNPKYKEPFFDARYHVSYCRYLAGKAATGAQRKDHLTKAKQGIRSMYQLYPDLGGPTFEAKYNGLLKDVQTALDEDAIGLKEFKTNNLK